MSLDEEVYTFKFGFRKESRIENNGYFVRMTYEQWKI